MKLLLLTIALSMCTTNIYADKDTSNRYINRACAKILAAPSFQAESVYMDEWYKLEDLANVPADEAEHYEVIQAMFNLYKDNLRLASKIKAIGGEAEPPWKTCAGTFDFFLPYFAERK